ncbi:hypothetical protein BH10ACI2_BH10ACI2_14310 [soil metagenome]
MQSEKVLGSELAASGIPPSRSQSSKAGFWIWIHLGTFILGLAILVYVIYRIGYESIFQSISTVGWGFAVIVSLNLVRHLARASSMYLAIDPQHRTFNFRNVVAARFGGEAVTFFTFTGPFLGDATKAALLRKDLPLTYGASAVITDNILYYVSVILVMLTGIAALLLSFGRNGSSIDSVLIVVVASLVLVFLALSFAMRFRITPISRFINFLSNRKLAPQFLLKVRRNILDVETNVFQFYKNRRADFYKLFFISMTVHFLSVLEVYCALVFLDFKAAPSTALIIESLTKVINAVFGFIPGTIGVYEGGNGVILQTLGYTVAAGVALALVRRGAILVSTMIGVLILLWRTAGHGVKHLATSDD